MSQISSSKDSIKVNFFFKRNNLLNCQISNGSTVIPADLFFAKGSSLLYAFNQEEEFCTILKNCRLCIFDYSFSLSDQALQNFVSTGKPVTFLSKSKCESLLKDKHKTLLIKPSSRTLKKRENILPAECIYGDSEVVKRYIEELNKKSIKS